MICKEKPNIHWIMWDLQQCIEFRLVSEFWKIRISDKNQFPFPAHMNVLGKPMLRHIAILIFNNNSMETRFLSCLPPICLSSFSIHCFSILCVVLLRPVTSHAWVTYEVLSSCVESYLIEQNKYGLFQCRRVFILPYGTRKKMHAV